MEETSEHAADCLYILMFPEPVNTPESRNNERASGEQTTTCTGVANDETGTNDPSPEQTQEVHNIAEPLETSRPPHPLSFSYQIRISTGPTPERSTFPTPEDFDLSTSNMHRTLIALSAVALSVALIFITSPPIQILHCASSACESLREMGFYAWVGLYCLISWASVVTGQFWVLDILGGRSGQLCGNKFMNCRPWD